MKTYDENSDYYIVFVFVLDMTGQLKNEGSDNID